MQIICLSSLKRVSSKKFQVNIIFVYLCWLHTIVFLAWYNWNNVMVVSSHTRVTRLKIRLCSNEEREALRTRLITDVNKYTDFAIHDKFFFVFFFLTLSCSVNLGATQSSTRPELYCCLVMCHLKLTRA